MDQTEVEKKYEELLIKKETEHTATIIRLLGDSKKETDTLTKYYRNKLAEFEKTYQNKVKDLQSQIGKNNDSDHGRV